MQILADRIEFCWIHLRGIGTLENSLWGYDGQKLRVWLNALSIESSPQQEMDEPQDVEASVKIPLDFYPLCKCRSDESWVYYANVLCSCVDGQRNHHRCRARSGYTNESTFCHVPSCYQRAYFFRLPWSYLIHQYPLVASIHPSYPRLPPRERTIESGCHLCVSLPTSSIFRTRSRNSPAQYSRRRRKFVSRSWIKRRWFTGPLDEDNRVLGSLRGFFGYRCGLRSED